MRKAAFLIFGLVGAALLSQFPEFFQQYTQRLGGRLDEVRTQVEALEQRAAASGKTLNTYLEQFLVSRDRDVQQEGRALAVLVQRRAAMATAYSALSDASQFWRARAFAEHVDMDIAKATARDYKPATPLTAESAVYSGAGFGAGGVAYSLLFGWRRKRRAMSRGRD
jgi:hypothetical protein